MMGHREKMKSEDQYDALTRARRMYKHLTRAGAAHEVKKLFARRVRRDQKLELSKGLGE